MPKAYSKQIANNLDEQDKFYLLMALELARQKRGFCAPNPAVGAVITDINEKVIATGYHSGVGFNHAEIEALNQLLGRNAKPECLYVTLEPCCHWGRTPPCTDAIIKAGIKRVIYGYKDPNPLVAGKGVNALIQTGIVCHQMSIPEINQFYQSYHHWHVNKTPFITGKIAMTLNGAIAGSNNEPIKITGVALSELTHLKRKVSDAILTTARTIHYDNPQLNVRLQNETILKSIYVLDARLSISSAANIFITAKSVTLFHSRKASQENIERLTMLGARCINVSEHHDKLSLVEIISLIGKDGVHDLWIEAGGKCLKSFLDDNLMNKLLIYIAPGWIKNGKLAFEEGLDYHMNDHSMTWKQYGNDVVCEISISN